MAARREYSIASISKMLAILDHLAEYPGTGFTDLYQRVGLPKSSTYQIVQNLISEGLIRCEDDKNLYLGMRLFEYGQAAASLLDVRSVALPILRSLAAQTCLTAHLGILNDRQQGLFLERIDGGAFTFTHTKVGARISLETSATGRALVAWQNAAQRRDLIAHMRFEPDGVNRIHSPEAYEEECRRTVARGYSMDRCESQPNINGIGVPIYDASGEVCAAIAIGGIYVELDLDACDSQVAALRKAGAEISANMGCAKYPA